MKTKAMMLATSLGGAAVVLTTMAGAGIVATVLTGIVAGVSALAYLHPSQD